MAETDTEPPPFPVTDPPDTPGSTWDEPGSDTPQSGRRKGGSRAASSRGTGKGSTSQTPRSPGGGSGRPTAGPARDLRARLEEWFSGMALLPMAVGDHYSAHIIASRAGHLAEAWADLAKTNPGVRKVLEGMLQGGAWGGVILASGSVLVPILGHYGLLPPVDPWAGLYGPPPVPQGRRPIVPPPPGQTGPQAPPQAPQGPGMGHHRGAPPIVPDNPRANGAGTVATNSDGTGDMTPPIAPGQPAGVVTVAGSRSRAVQTPSALPQDGHTEGGGMTEPIAPGQPAGTVTVAGSRNRAGGNPATQ